MSCQEYQHQISLFLYEELPETEKPGLDSHLSECEPCRLLFEEEKGLHFVLAEDAAAFEIPSDLLVASRRELANELDRIEKKRSWWRIPAFSVVFTPMRLLESAALVAMGLALGVYVSNQQATSSQIVSGPVPESAIVSAIPANGSVSNLRIVSANPTTGQVELAGEIVQPLRMQSNMGDSALRQLLIGALGNATNAGSRLRAVEVLSQSPGDQMIKEALIQALTYDSNPGVRLRAIQGLSQYASQEDVRAALMSTLKNDGDAGIRMEAVETLTRNSKDAALAKALVPFSKDDDNYVRMKVLQFVGSNQ